MAQSRYYSATAQPTVLTSGITNTQVTINVVAVTGFPASVPYILALDYNTPSEEIVLVTAQAGTTLTVTRAYDGTSGTSHNSGAGVRHTWTAKDGNDSREHEASSQGIHGLGPLSSVVGTTDTQTLTNKTLVSPVITGTLTNPDIQGVVTGSAVYLHPTFKADVDANPSEIVQRRSATQTGDLTDWKDDSAATLASVDKNGVSHWLGGMTAGSTGQLSVNASGVISTSAVPAFLGGLTAGSSAQWSVDSTGNLTAAGNVTTAVWNSYTPTWTGITGMTAGTTSGRWAKVGRTYFVAVQANFTAGSTMSGSVSFTLPTSASGFAAGAIGNGWYNDPGVAFRPLVPIIISGSPSTATVFALTTNSSQFVNPSLVYGWSATAQINAFVTYEGSS